jgi:selenocysteine-specific elongation factor
VTLRLLPGDATVRVREVQVRGGLVGASAGGRTALLLGGLDAEPRRGQVVTTDPDVVATSRILVAMRPPGLGATPAAGALPAVPAAPADRERLRLHLGTDQVGALVVRGPHETQELDDGRTLAILRLDAPITAAPGDRFALRRPSPGSVAGGGVVLDPQPPRGISRRRMNGARATALATALVGAFPARLDLHGALADGGAWRLAEDVDAALRARAVELVTAHHVAQPDTIGIPMADLRAHVATTARRLVTLTKVAAATVAASVVDTLLAEGTLARDGDRVRDASRAGGLPATTLAAMDRLEAALSVASPPSLAEAASLADCPPDGVRALETAGRIVRLEDDLAWASATYRDLVRRALAMAGAAPLTPAAYRDATGSSRRYVMVILEDLDRRGLLRRTDAGHVLGPKTLARMREREQTATAAE